MLPSNSLSNLSASLQLHHHPPLQATMPSYWNKCPKLPSLCPRKYQLHKCCQSTGLPEAEWLFLLKLKPSYVELLPKPHRIFSSLRPVFSTCPARSSPIFLCPPWLCCALLPVVQQHWPCHELPFSEDFFLAVLTPWPAAHPPPSLAAYQPFGSRSSTYWNRCTWAAREWRKRLQCPVKES